jgi:acyl-CoA synthetase (AMP-forming)/AMP-acid ligase II
MKEIVFSHGERLISDYVAIHAEQTPEKTAVNFYGRLITYKELNELVNRFATALADLGYTKGDRIGYFGQTSPQAYITYLAGMKLGLLNVPLDPMYKEFELAYALNDSEITVVVTFGDIYPIVKKAKNKTKLKDVIVTDFDDFLPEEPPIPFPDKMKTVKSAFPDTHDFMELIEKYEPNPPEINIDMSEYEWILYTGGTTGFPKGCLHTHANSLLAGFGTAQLAYKATADDVLLNSFPVTHVSGMCLIGLPTFLTGMTVISLTRWEPVAAMAAIEKFKPTLIMWPTPCYTSIIDHPDVEKYDLTSLRTCGLISFVKPLTKSLSDKWEKITGSPIYNGGYRMTENFCYCTTGCFHPFEEFNFGPPNPGVQLKIVDLENRNKELPVGSRGEVAIKSPCQFLEYINKPEETQKDLIDGWFYTGDMGALSEGGDLYFYGRHREALKVSGYTVIPKEIEAIGLQNEAIDKIAVIGIPDPKKGEVPKAFVTLNPGFQLDSSDLEKWFKASISAIKAPLVEIRDQLPLSTKGEVLKKDLAAEEAAKRN